MGSQATVSEQIASFLASLRETGLSDQQIQTQMLSSMAISLHADVSAGAPNAVVPVAQPNPAQLNSPGVCSWEHLGSTKEIDFIKLAPLIEQGPFRPEDLASVQFKAGDRTVYALNAPCQSGKSPSMVYLTLKAMDEGCWVLVILNINNNRAISNLVSKFQNIHQQLGAPAGGKLPVIRTDTLFHQKNASELKLECERLEEPTDRSIWIVKANEDSLAKLVTHVPPAAWARCVVFFDEVHCFFSLEPTCEKKAEKYMCSILFGGDGEINSTDGLAMLRPRSVVFSDATDGDVPHVFKRFNLLPEDFTRICADPERLEAMGYVSSNSFELFKVMGLPAMVKSFRSDQRYGKDYLQRLPAKDKVSVNSDSASGSDGEREAEQPRGVTGSEFAQQATMEDFDPNLLAFYKDAFQHHGNKATFLLELTTSEKSEHTTNSVLHHAQCIARLFPEVLALAEHGKGCFHIKAVGDPTEYSSHRLAYEALQAPLKKYYGKPKYLITNLGYGSIQFAFPAAPVTHIYVGFAAYTNNLLIKAQGLGRACGYIRKDLEDCGVDKVRVLCTEKQLNAMTRGLTTFMAEAFEQYPLHAVGTYTDDLVCNSHNGHRANRMVAQTRSTALVRRASGVGAASSSRGADVRRRAARGEVAREALYNSIESVIDVQLREGRALVHEHGTITIQDSPEYERAIMRKHPGILITSKLVFIKGNSQQHAEGLRCASNLSVTPSSTAFGMAARDLQAKQFASASVTNLAFLSLERPEYNNNVYNVNPAHFGKRGGADGGQGSYGMVWGYDQPAQHALGIARIVSFSQLSLPFIYHKLLLNADGSFGVSAMLVTEKLRDEAGTSKKRAIMPPTQGGKPKQNREPSESLGRSTT